MKDIKTPCINFLNRINFSPQHNSLKEGKKSKSSEEKCLHRVQTKCNLLYIHLESYNTKHEMKKKKERELVWNLVFDVINFRLVVQSAFCTAQKNRRGRKSEKRQNKNTAQWDNNQIKIVNSWNSHKIQYKG